MEIAYDNILDMGFQIKGLINLYKVYAEHDVHTFLEEIPNHEYKLKDEVLVRFWNRGYAINVNKVRLRKDGEVMACGINLYNDKEDEEFFSYILHFTDMKEVVDNVIPEWW